MTLAGLLFVACLVIIWASYLASYVIARVVYA